MPPSQTQTRPRFANLYADSSNNDPATTLFNTADKSINKHKSIGHNNTAREIGSMAAAQQHQVEEAEKRRKQKEASKYSLKKQVGKQALDRFLRYNNCLTEEELKRANIPFIDVLSKLESTQQSDILEALQEALDMVYHDLGVDDEDRMPVTPQMMKALLAPWDRPDPDSLTTGFGSNLFLYGPRDRAKSAEQAELFKSTFFATNAPDADVLIKLNSDEILVPTISDVGYTIRGMERLMRAVLRPGHPHLQSLAKVTTKWTNTERSFALGANGDNDPARGIYLLEALNMLMNEYWREQKTSKDLIAGWDGLSIFRLIRGKKQWKPELSPKYRIQLKLDLFV